MSRSKLLKSFVAAFTVMAFIGPTIASAAAEGDVIKVTCTAEAAIDDSCRAVYYLGLDGERHAFPNEDVYLSWYENFDNVIDIDEAEMNDLALGKNVTLKPGVKVVKFQTDDAIYAVAEGGVLRHYLTPSLVAVDYGDDWAERDFVVMPDTFFNDYQVGEEIDSDTDYDPAEAERGVLSIDDNF